MFRGLVDVYKRQALLFFFKQKTAYELLISYWSSDVCSSDLKGGLEPPRPKPLPPQGSASTNSATWANSRCAPLRTRNTGIVSVSIALRNRLRLFGRLCLRLRRLGGCIGGLRRCGRHRRRSRRRHRSAELRVGKGGVRTGRSRW